MKKTKTTKTADSANKGRDSKLLVLRDKALVRRYYHLTEVRRVRFDDAMKILSEYEFFLSEERIMKIIRRNMDMLKELRKGSD